MKTQIFIVFLSCIYLFQAYIVIDQLASDSAGFTDYEKQYWVVETTDGSSITEQVVTVEGVDKRILGGPGSNFNMQNTVYVSAYNLRSHTNIKVSYTAYFFEFDGNSQLNVDIYRNSVLKYNKQFYVVGDLVVESYSSPPYLHDRTSMEIKFTPDLFGTFDPIYTWGISDLQICIGTGSVDCDPYVQHTCGVGQTFYGDECTNNDIVEACIASLAPVRQNNGNQKYTFADPVVVSEAGEADVILSPNTIYHHMSQCSTYYMSSDNKQLGTQDFLHVYYNADNDQEIHLYLTAESITEEQLTCQIKIHQEEYECKVELNINQNYSIQYQEVYILDVFTTMVDGALKITSIIPTLEVTNVEKLGDTVNDINVVTKVSICDDWDCNTTTETTQDSPVEVKKDEVVVVKQEILSTYYLDKFNLHLYNLEYASFYPPIGRYESGNAYVKFEFKPVLASNGVQYVINSKLGEKDVANPELAGDVNPSTNSAFTRRRRNLSGEQLEEEEDYGIGQQISSGFYMNVVEGGSDGDEIKNDNKVDGIQNQNDITIQEKESKNNNNNNLIIIGGISGVVIIVLVVLAFLKLKSIEKDRKVLKQQRIKRMKNSEKDEEKLEQQQQNKELTTCDRILPTEQQQQQ